MLLKNCDRVKIACLAQLVNVIAPIMTKKGGPAWRQTTFYPFADVANHGAGTVMTPIITSPQYSCEEFSNVNYVEAIAVFNEEKGEIIIFAVNRAEKDGLEFEIELQGFRPRGIAAHSEISGHGIKQVNTAGADIVRPVAGAGAVVDGHTVRVDLKPLSWNMLRVQV
jgi:alpha-N-arabinofuranosidase